MKLLIESEFKDSIKVKQDALSAMDTSIAQAAECLISVLKNGNKILMCGNGGSAADAQHFAAELVNRFETERQPLAGIALTTDSSILTSIANDYSYEQIFSKQVQAFGKIGDWLVAISTSGNSQSILNAVEVALANDISVISFTGKDGGKLAKIKHPLHIELRVPNEKTARIQEVHILIIHILCKLIDQAFTK